MTEKDGILRWLLEGPAWIQYRARRDLLGQAESHPKVKESRKAMIADPMIGKILSELADWPGPVLTSHKSAGHPLHKLVFIADLGFNVQDSGVERIVARILAHRSAEGPFQVMMNIPVHFGGTGEDRSAWALCDSPSIAYALSCFGLGKDSRVEAAVAHLAGLAGENGWPCAVSPELGKFRGPGRKDDPCPYANLVMLKVMERLPKWRNSPAAHAGAKAILSQWERRRASHPYMFYMGTDFSKLKAPLVWYDVLHVTDVLARFSWLRDDVRLGEMLAVLQGKVDPSGRYMPESVWTAWKEWEFSMKRAPSRWLTFLALRAAARM
jgi:hypothetical protein